MITRILEPIDYHRLTGTEAEAVIARLTDAARVVVVEDEGQIVGCHVLQPIVHAECLWIHPAYRKKTGVGRRLWAAVQREVREHFGARAFATAALSDEVRLLLMHVKAVKLDGDHYMVPVEG